MNRKFPAPLNKAKKFEADLYVAILKGEEVFQLCNLDAFPECPNQRPTEYRCKRRDHLKGDARMGQETVYMGYDVSEKVMYMLDGNSRRHNWAKGVLKAPKTVFAMIRILPNVQAVNEAYYCFDNSGATMTPAELIAGADHAVGIGDDCWLLRKRGTGERACAAVGIGLASNYNVLTANKGKGFIEKVSKELEGAFHWIANACEGVEPENMRGGNSKFWTAATKAALFTCVHDALRDDNYAMLDYWLEVIREGRDHDRIREIERNVRQLHVGPGRNVQEDAMFQIIKFAQSEC
ncbi:hypothetical protein ABVU25_005014 [Escherichia coli]